MEELKIKITDLENSVIALESRTQDLVSTNEKLLKELSLLTTEIIKLREKMD